MSEGFSGRGKTRPLTRVPLKPTKMTNEPIKAPRQFTVAQAAQYLGLHSRTVYELAMSPKMLRARRKGPRKGRIFFLQKDLDAYLGDDRS